MKAAVATALLLQGALGGKEPVYRYWKPAGADHFYTRNVAEIGTATHGQWGNHGYVSEGVGWFAHAAASEARGLIPVYRSWNGGAVVDHFYTNSKAEWDEAKAKHGYAQEGIVGYCFEHGITPVYRYWNPVSKDHFYTKNIHEIGTATVGQVGKHGYKSEGVLCYENPPPDQDCTHEGHCPLHCYASGDPHIRMFNGLVHHFQGGCAYDYAASCDNDVKKVPFAVVGSHWKCGGSHGIHCFDFFTLKLYGKADGKLKAQLLLNYRHAAVDQANGNRVLVLNQQVNYDGTSWYKLVQTGGIKRVIVATDTFSHKPDLHVRAQANHGVVRISAAWQTKKSVCGLCGSLDGDNKNQFTFYNGKQREVVNSDHVSNWGWYLHNTHGVRTRTDKFGDAWRDKTVASPRGAPAHCHAAEIEVSEECLAEAKDICDAYFQEHGCGAFDKQKFMDGCTFDACETTGNNMDEDVLEKAVKAQYLSWLQFRCAKDQKIRQVYIGDQEIQVPRGKVFGRCTPQDNLEVSFSVKPKAHIGNWGSLIHFGSTNHWRVPAVWFYPGQFRLHMREGSVRSWNDGPCVNEGQLPPLQAGKWYTISFGMYEDGSIEYYLNGELVCRRENYDWRSQANGPVYAGDPWHPAGNALIRHFHSTTWAIGGRVATYNHWREGRNCQQHINHCSDYCIASGDPHIRMFDGKQNHFQGQCAYYYATACERAADFHKRVPFDVVGLHRKCGSMSCFKEFTLRLYSLSTGKHLQTVRIQRGKVTDVTDEKNPKTVNQNEAQYYDKVEASKPHWLWRGNWFGYTTVWVYTGITPRVWYDLAVMTNGNGYIRASKLWEDEVCGLCGAFNRNNADDFTVWDDKAKKRAVIDSTGCEHWGNIHRKEGSYWERTEQFGNAWLDESVKPEEGALCVRKPPLYTAACVAEARKVCNELYDDVGCATNREGVHRAHFLDECQMDACMMTENSAEHEKLRHAAKSIHEVTLESQCTIGSYARFYRFLSTNRGRIRNGWRLGTVTLAENNVFSFEFKPDSPLDDGKVVHIGNDINTQVVVVEIKDSKLIVTAQNARLCTKDIALWPGEWHAFKVSLYANGHATLRVDGDKVCDRGPVADPDFHQNQNVWATNFGDPSKGELRQFRVRTWDSFAYKHNAKPKVLANDVARKVELNRPIGILSAKKDNWELEFEIRPLAKINQRSWFLYIGDKQSRLPRFGFERGTTRLLVEESRQAGVAGIGLNAQKATLPLNEWTRIKIGFYSNFVVRIWRGEEEIGAIKNFKWNRFLKETVWLTDPWYQTLACDAEVRNVRAYRWNSKDESVAIAQFEQDESAFAANEDMEELLQADTSTEQAAEDDSGMDYTDITAVENYGVEQELKEDRQADSAAVFAADSRGAVTAVSLAGVFVSLALYAVCTRGARQKHAVADAKASQYGAAL